VLHLSVVNLAEVFQHARDYVRATGLDPLALLSALRVSIHAPDSDTARRVADLSLRGELSLADRFAAATAQTMAARLYTTDRPLAVELRRRRLPVTLY
jgi:predicted nucleic acid-binding protein